MSRVLVIDDEEGVLASVKRRLERHGLEVTSASLAEDGIRLIQNSQIPYDVIVTDMSMESPESGIQVLQAALKRDVIASVIVMTAYGNVANAVECMRRGAFDYLEKNSPSGDVYETLIAKVDMAIERRRHDLRTLERFAVASELP